MEVVTPDKGEIMPPGTPRHITPEPSTNDPPMFYPRPSSERAQDVSHILASTFRDLYTKDVMGKDTVKNLTTSSEGSNAFHKKCMKQLKEAHEEHKRCLEEFTMLEQHIIQARARATSADERALVHAANESSPQKYKELGLPPVKSNFRWCLQEDLLRKHNLLVPSDLLPRSKSLIDGPKAAHTPHFAIPTLSSTMHLVKGPVDDGYTSKEELMAFEELDLKDVEDVEDGVTTLSTNSEVLLSSPPRTMIQAQRTKASWKKKTDRWQEHMSHDQRVADRADLARMEERHNFLRNPRHLPLNIAKASKLLTKDQPKAIVEKAGREILQSVCRNEAIQIFISKPEIVLFTEWSVGRVYEAVLELKNVSCVSRQLRVIPPTTSFFSIGLGKYPGVHGLVAPGMSAQFNVRFMPDSLADYEDFIMVVSQAEEPLKVGLQAKRKPPALTIPRNLHCGHCLVGGSKIEELVVKNNGGNGRFCILRKTSWPAANFKTVVRPGSLDLGAFQIRPAVFELLAGQTMVIELVFSPTEIEKYTENLVIVCDNCQVQDLTIDGEGQAAAVELVSVSDGGEDQPRLGEISDMTADHLIRFPALNPHSFYMKQVLVHNSINVEMPYAWHILKPNFQTSLRPDEQSLVDRFEFYPDNSPAFFIEPQRGTLQPNGIHEFVVTFAPHLVGSYHNVLHLVLSNIPQSSAGERKQAQMQSGPNVAQETVPPAHVGRKSPLVANVTGPSQLPKRESPGKGGISSMSSKIGGNQLREVIALEIELKGESIPYSVLLHPPAIVVPGFVLEGTTVKRPFKMANYSLAPVQYKWSSETQPNIIEVEPPLGVIDPGEYAELEVSITGSKPGPLESILQCKVEHLNDPLNLAIQANIEGPKVEIENPIVDFGLVRLGDTVSQKVTLRNTTQLPALWTFLESEQFRKSSPTERRELQITPDVGELGPLGQVDLKITFKPSNTQKLSTVLDLNVKDGKSCNLALTADVQTPQACFENCEVICKEAFLSVPQLQKAQLINLTSLTAKFWFGEAKGRQTKECGVTVHPREGILAPRERLEIQITFVCHAEGEVSNVVLPCYVQGMDKPIVLGFYANIKSLDVLYTTPDSDCDELKVKYDDPVMIRTVVTKRIAFENVTAIRAPWSVTIRNFAARPPAPPSVKCDFKSANTRRAMLGRTPNLADPMGKTKKQAHKDHCNLMLSSGLGAAFIVKPSHGFLEPYQTQFVDIEAYSNMWGNYRDIVECNIEGLPTKLIPLEMNVTGCPLSFQVVAGQEEKLAVVRFGTHINNGPQVARKMKINNSSPNDIRIDFKVFNTPEMDDKKLLDLNVWYGAAFPRKDPEGNEIVPELSDVQLEYSNDSPKTESTARSNLTDESLTQFEAQPQIVSLRLEPHHGQLANSPFTMVPSQTIVPAHGNAIVSAVFSPILDRHSENKDKEWISYAHGFMSLDDQNLKDVPNKLSRLDGYSVAPLKLQLTASVRTGSLRIEPDEDEDEKQDGDGGIQFKIPISDMLLLNTRVASEAVRYRYCTLLNDTEMPLDFKLSIVRPFFLSTGKEKGGHQNTKEIRIETSARNRLRPQENMRIKIGFNLSSVMIDAIKSLRNEDTIPGVNLQRDSTTGAECMHFQDDLAISFSNGSSQAMLVRAKVFIPCLRLSVFELDFGTCFVGQEKCLQFRIENVGEAHSLWNAVSESGERSLFPDCFRVEPSNGFLEGYTTHLAKNKMILSVFFVPSCDEACSTVFTFSGVLGEERQQILVRGKGSYDGKYAAE